MNRIDLKFQELRELKRKAFIAYITAGYPDLASTEDMVLALEKAGVDIIELGVPFSDPMADGPTIQRASFLSLQQGTTPAMVLETVQRIRKRSEVPIALMGYYNPVHHWGDEAFVAAASKAGVDGLIIPDLPVEESGSLRAAAKAQGVALVSFVAPTTGKERLGSIVEAATGFVYFVAVAGVTGARQQVSGDIARQVKLARGLSITPVCVGFGVSTPEQVKDVASFADGVIVGSAIIKEIEKNIGHSDMPARVAAFVKKLAAPLR